MNKAHEKPKSAPLLSQPGRGDGPVIQGFAPSKFLTGSAVYAVAPGTVWQVSATTDFAYEAGAAVVMPAVPGANYVIPNGVEELHLTTPAVIVAFAGRAATGFATIINEQPNSPGGQIVNGRVILVGFMVSDIIITATGENLTYQWYRDNQILAGQATASLTGNGKTLLTGKYYCVITGNNGIKTSNTIELFAHNGEFTLDLGQGLDVTALPLYGFRIEQSIASGGSFDEPQIGELTPRDWPLGSAFARLSCGDVNDRVDLQAFGAAVNQFANATELTITSDGAMPDLVLPWDGGSDRYFVVDNTFAEYLRNGVGTLDLFTLTPTAF